MVVWSVMAGGSLRSSNSHYPRNLFSLLVLTAVLAVCSRAQDMTEDMLTVDITLATDRNRTTAIVPSRVDAVYVIGSETLEFTNSSSPNITSSMVMCEGTNCTVMLLDMYADPTVVVTISFNTDQFLVLTIREDLDDSCKQYNVPQRAAQSVHPYIFTCEPLDNATDVTIMWRKFSRLEEVRMFQRMKAGCPDGTTNCIINTGGIYTLSGTRLMINRSMTSDEDVAFYYVPSFRVQGMAMEERVTAETVIFVGPTITTQRREFSIEITFGSSKSRNFTEIACEARTFPPAFVSWELVNPEFEDGIDLVGFDAFGSSIFLLDSSSTNFTTVRSAIVQFTNMSYEEDGVFTCTVDNTITIASQSVRIRVKSPLRPLWPALGIIGVALLVSLFMLGAFSVEKIIEKKKQHQYIEGSSNHADGQRLSSVSSAGGQANSRGGKKHGAVKRLSSNKPLIDESSL